MLFDMLLWFRKLYSESLPYGFLKFSLFTTYIKNQFLVKVQWVQKHCEQLPGPGAAQTPTGDQQGQLSKQIETI